MPFGPDWVVEPDTVTYTWSDESGQSEEDAWKNGDNTGRSVTWIAPGTAGTYTVTVTVDDQGANAPEGCVVQMTTFLNQKTRT